MQGMVGLKPQKGQSSWNPDAPSSNANGGLLNTLLQWLQTTYAS